MNKFLLGLNILLIAAVGVLFYLHFEYIDSDKHNIKQAQSAAANTFKIAYFDLDSLQEKYIYYREEKDYLTQKDAQYRKELNDIRVRYQAKVKEYQEKGPTLSQNQQSEYEQLLMKLQNDYSVKEQENSNAMQSHMADRLPPVKMKIQEYLKRFSSNRGYAYVFASNKDDDIFYYKDSIRNITDSIIIGLNKEYEDSRKK